MFLQKYAFHSEVCAAASPGDPFASGPVSAAHVGMRAFLRRSWKLFVIAEAVPETGDRSPRSFSRSGLLATLLEPVLQTDRVSKTGITEKNRCQLYSVYNRPDGKQASFYFYLIQHRDKERGAITTASNLPLIKILQDNGRIASK